ncbi:MAG: isoaspartyl peptidase/L-asparaginase [Acidobacteria bacterium]|nr:isoaspartyl peptidase/L-asparaginase [Acidobacteriota bacterium]
MPRRWGIVIHTGASRFTLESLGDRQAEMRAAMSAALTAGHEILASGGSSVEAVEAAVVVLEDSPHCNAGRGAVFTRDATHELDAAIMDGRTMTAGAVAAVRRVKNPVRLARLVMERSAHVLLVGDGAEAFGRMQGGIEFVPETYFHTDFRWEQLQRALARAGGSGGVGGLVGLDRQGGVVMSFNTSGMGRGYMGRTGKR